MGQTNEPRALSAALSGPAMTTRAGGLAMHVADRHVERWAPETTAHKSRPLRNLSFVDKTIAPWIETAQRSASLRLFSQYRADGLGERQPANVSWVFPRPWYQDELDWMAAAREAQARPQLQQPMLTTRGTYVQPAQVQQAPAALPAALYEYVAPSLSIAQPTTEARGIGYGGSEQAYSPLVPLAAVQAAEVMQRAIAPAMVSPSARPALRNVLSTMLERAAMPSRVSMQAPELVTPPAPRDDRAGPVEPSAREVASEQAPSEAMQLAERYAEQRAQIAEVQRVARVAAEREMAARIEAARAQIATQTTASPTAATPSVRDASVRAEAELRARTQQDTITAAKAEAERTERARIEERIAQRLAERSATARLHEQSRAEAAAHARAEAERATPAAPVVEQPRSSAQLTAQPTAPAEVAAAIAALPPELQAFIGQRAGGSMRAIDELGEALRTVELLSRAAASGTAFESSRGPRLMMPAGLGGLVATIDRAQPAPTLAPLRLAQAMPAVAPMQAPPAARAATSRMEMMRVPAMQFVTGAAPAAPASAFEAAAAAKPAALSHVAWADRWLARFAGASQQSLDTFGAASSFDRAARIQALSAAAPDSIFVAPVFDVERGGDTVRFEASGHPVVTPRGVAAPLAPSIAPRTTQAIEQPQPRQDVVRIADDAETPDEVFAAISAGATRARTVHRAPQPAQTSEPSTSARTFDRPTVADAVAHATPSAPGAGFAAQLASSPFAPALRHVLPLPSAQSFDVRSLFGGGLSATYLAGLLASSPDEIHTTISRWAQWQQPSADALAPADVPGRDVPAFDATYVAPDALDALELTPDAIAAQEAPATAPEALTTMRSALLSWNVETTPGGTTVFAPAEQAAAPTVISRTSVSPIAAPTAHTMMETLSLPLLDDGDVAAEQGAARTAPGMLAERAHAFSVAQERSSADLAFDFVPPELVLAARVYGLGPVEAAQAARLAIAGPGHLTAMAGAVDRTFVQAMTMEAARRESIATAYPSSAGDVVAATRAAQTPIGEDVAAPHHAPTGTSFGVDRKPPRGAFLWPSATVAALGLNAAAPDGQSSMSVAALELLAAQAVAELGTFTALSDAEPAPASEGEATPRAFPGRETSTVTARGDATPSSEPAEGDVLASASALVPSSRRARFDALYVALSQSASSASWSPAARAARALALAGRGEDGPVTARERAAFAWDVLPVVYADSLASFGGERTAAAFGGETPSSVTASDGTTPDERRARAAGRAPGAMIDRRTIGGREYVAADDVNIDGRPGLAALSSRAGEALGSYVTPAAPSSSSSSASTSSSSSSPREVGAVLRAPTAAQELVRTGSGRHGGGETEIPAWFEKAARKMLEDRSAPSDGISMAELTLVTAAPSAQIAASTRTAPSANPITPGTNSQAQPSQAGAADIDVEKIANDIYRHILVMMDVARARNGEPYL